MLKTKLIENNCENKGSLISRCRHLPVSLKTQTQHWKQSAIEMNKQNISSLDFKSLYYVSLSRPLWSNKYSISTNA